MLRDGGGGGVVVAACPGPELNEGRQRGYGSRGSCPVVLRGDLQEAFLAGRLASVTQGRGSGDGVGLDGLDLLGDQVWDQVLGVEEFRGWDEPRGFLVSEGLAERPHGVNGVGDTAAEVIMVAWAIPPAAEDPVALATLPGVEVFVAPQLVRSALTHPDVGGNGHQ